MLYRLCYTAVKAYIGMLRSVYCSSVTLSMVQFRFMMGTFCMLHEKRFTTAPPGRKMKFGNFSKLLLVKIWHFRPWNKFLWQC